MHASGYRETAHLGPVPFGEAWQAIDTVDGSELVVVRAARSGPAARVDGGALERLAEETRLLTRAHGGGLVRVRSVTGDRHRVQAIFEPVTGISLGAWLAAPGSRSPEEVIAVARGLLAAMAEAHALDVPHRGLGLEDVRLDDQLHVTVSGFGMTRLTASPPATSAPEVAAGQPATLRTDQYNLGVILDRLAGAASPPLDVSSVVATACAPRPEQRYGDVFDMAAAFEEAVAGQRSAQPVETVMVTSPESGRSRRLAVLAASAAGIVLSLAVAVGVTGRPAATGDAISGADRAEPTRTVFGSGPQLIDEARRLIEAGQLAETVPLLEATLEDPSLATPAPIHATLGTIRLKLGDPDGAVDDLQRAVSLAPRGDLYYSLSLALASSGRDDAARAAIAAGLRLEPDHRQLDEAHRRLRLGG